MLVTLLPSSGGHDERAVMQGAPDHPVWQLLRDHDLEPAQWAATLMSELDGNGQTDFLDMAAATGQRVDAELLVYAPDDVRSALPGTDIPEVGATFLVWPLQDLDTLHERGAQLIVWEPRAYAHVVNPAGGSPASMPQNRLHDVDDAWTAGYSGANITIAVIDTGANPSHDALSGKVTSFKDCTSSATAAYDDHGHGTHVASIAAGDDGSQFRGVAYDAELQVVKILDQNGSGTLAWFKCALTYIKNGGSPIADVASMSAGLAVPPLGITTLNGGQADLFGWDTPANSLVSFMPFAVAAGNHIGTLVEVIGADETYRVGVNGVNQVSSPAFGYWVTAVGAMDTYRAPATFSALGPGRTVTEVKPDVVTLGVDVWGARHNHVNDYVAWDGTSMATPIVAGVIALMMEEDATRTPDTYRQYLREEATSTCVLATGPTSCWGGLEQPMRPSFADGYGLVHALGSINRL